MNKLLMFVLILVCATVSSRAQDVKVVEICDRAYSYTAGNDSVTLFLKVLDSDMRTSSEITVANLENHLDIYEDGEIISPRRRVIRSVDSGLRIPSDYTFSVLIDQTISSEGRDRIYQAVCNLVESAPDSCVYLSFFGDEVGASELATKDNIKDFKGRFSRGADSKFFYGAIYSKLAEFSPDAAEYEDRVRTNATYKRNSAIAQRAANSADKNLLVVFTEGRIRPEDEDISFVEVTELEEKASSVVPRVYAFYDVENGIDENVELTLQGITSPRDANGKVIENRHGDYKPSDDINSVLANFEEVVQNAMYDFSYTYQATEAKVYSGRTSFNVRWKDVEVGNRDFSIGSAETPWPVYEETASDSLVKYLMAALVTVLTFLFFFVIMKVLLPYIKSKSFAVKYYTRYVPEANVANRICYYCKKPLSQGDRVVTKCEHIMHVHCWQDNGYKCAEYGQNCKVGIQEHVDWKSMFTMRSLLDCRQTLSGILAGLVSWVVFELIGRGGFNALSEWIVATFYTNEDKKDILWTTCVSKVSAFLMIGLLLGFFLSLIFRYHDEYRSKNWKIYLKIFTLSVVSGLVGMMAFAVGGMILCVWTSAIDVTYLPWYCSFPAYLLFSLCLSLSLTIKSTIPVKSAMIGGAGSAVIGFLVLYFSSFAGTKWGWMNMLLDFVIYGGGLGASLIAARTLAEKYFLVIQNGVKAGQRIPIHKWMSATGGGQMVTIGMAMGCEIQMNWEKSNKVAKEHVQLFIDHTKTLPVIKPLATGVIYNTRAELPVGKQSVLSNNDTFKVGDTIFKYVEND